MTIKKLLTIFCLSLTLTASVVYAEDSSSSATSVEEIQKSLQERIKKAVQGNLQETSEPILRAFHGTVAGIADNTITISSNESTKHTTITDKTQIVRGGSKVKLESVKIGEGIIAMGFTSDLQNQTASRIVLYEPTEPKYTYNLTTGSIAKIDKQETKITFSFGNQETVVSYSSKTTLLDSQRKTIKLSSLQIDQQIAAIVAKNTQTGNLNLISLLLFDQSTPTPTTSNSRCGDQVCQDVVCQGIGCPTPETPETCPIDCTQ